MTKKILLGAVAALLLIGGTLGWRAWQAQSTEEKGAAPVSSELATATDAGDAATPLLQGREPLAAAPPTPPLDLAAVDRDRDLHGFVVDARGEPVAGARLTVLYHPWREDTFFAGLDRLLSTREGPTTASSTDGSFRLGLDEGDIVALRVEAPGLPTTTRWGMLAGERVRFVLPDPVRLVVIVKTPDGRPAPGVRVRLFPLTRERGFLVDERAETDREGRAPFEALPGGAVVLVLAFPAGGCRGAPPATLPLSGEHVLTLDLVEGLPLRGHVRDALTDKPIAGATVGRSSALLSTVQTDEEGAFAFPSWSPDFGPDLYAKAPGYARAQQRVEGADALDIALLPGGTLAGRVVDAEGAAVAGALVEATAGMPPSSEASDVTSGDGTFRLEGLDRCFHTLRVVARGHGRLRTPVQVASATEITDLGTLRLAPPLEIQGRVVGRDGHPLANAAVELAPGSAARLSQARFTDDIGRFRFVDLAPGPYVLRIKSRADVLAERRIVLKAGRRRLEVDIRLDLEAPGKRTLEIHVQGPDGEDLGGIEVRAFQDLKRVAQTRTDADGRATLDLPPGALVLAVEVPGSGHWIVPRPVQVSADDRTRDIHLERAVKLRGRLLGPDGEGIGLGIVWADLEKRPHAFIAATDGKGAFHMTLPAGRRVRLHFDGIVRESLRVKEHWVPLVGELKDVASDAADVVLQAVVVPTDRRLDVRILGPDGEGLEGVGVRLLAPDQESRDATTDATGRVHLEELPGLPVALYPLWTHTRQRPWRLAGPTPLRVTPDGQEVVVQLREGRRLEGTLLHPDGSPAAGGTVRTTQGGRRIRAKADDDGRFVVVLDPDDALPVDLDASATGPDGKRLTARQSAVHAGDGMITLRLEVWEPEGAGKGSGH